LRPGSAVWNNPDMSNQAPMSDRREHAMNIKTGVKIGDYPGGSYTAQECRNIFYDSTNRLLTAECEDHAGSLFHTSVFVPTKYDDIVNCSGELEINKCTGEVWGS
jgi:hypothetical protein